MRFLIPLALALVFSVNLSAQKNKRPNYKLLWQVSGNGLTKPSYLFGTMHVQDKRAFDLNDSVIAKIIHSEAFAMEVHPDSITQFMASILLDENKGKSIESQMTPKEFKYYDSLLNKKAGLSLTKFKTIKQANYFLEQRSVKKDKSTFLDAWLYNIARENRKKMAGLENFRSQMKLLQEDDSTELKDFKSFLLSEVNVDKSMTMLFDLYYDGDVEAIFSLMKKYQSPDKFKAMITDRNVIMTESFIKEARQHSLFAAVGAAHLGGDIGIVALLKQKGFTVTPVNAGFSGTANKYKSKGMTGDWFNFVSDEAGYSIDMPQQPTPLEMAGIPYKFQTYLDIGTFNFYMTTNIPLGVVVDKNDIGKTLDRMVSNMQNTQKVSNVKKVMINGYEGREFETISKGHFFKVNVVIAHANAYMLMVGPTKEAGNSADAKRFFQSLKVVKPPVAGVESFVSKEGAFSVDMPGKPSKQATTPTDPSSGKPFKIIAVFSSDNNSGVSCIVRYNDFPAGYVSHNDSSYIHGTLKAVYDKMDGNNLTTESIDFKGYPSTHFRFSNAEQTTIVDGIMTLRGERFFLIMATSPTTANPTTDAVIKNFLDSFKFLPYETPQLKDVTLEPGVSLKLPVTFEQDSAMVYGKDKSKTYAFVDPLSGMSFLATVEIFSKFQQAESAEKYFETLKKNQLTARDGTLIKDSTIADKLPTREFLYRTRNNAITRIRTVVAGDKVLQFWAYMPSNEQNLVLPDQFFNSIRVTSKSDWSLFADKLDVILKGVQSTDSTEIAEANEALGDYKFKEDQLPKVYEALKKQYTNDDDNWRGTRGILLRAFEKTHDENTVSFIQELYPTLPDTTALRDRAVGALYSLKTRESVRKGTDLIMNDNTGHKFQSYTTTNHLIDTLELFNDVAPDLINAFPKFDDKSNLYTMVKMSLDSNKFTAERKGQVVPMMIDMAAKMANLPATKDDELTYERYRAIEVLSSIPFTSQIEGIVRKLGSGEDDDTKLIMIETLLKNNAKVDPKDVDLLASKPDMRLYIYDDLKKYNKLDLINKKYSTTKMLAESEMYQYLSDADEYPDKIKFIKEKTVLVKGQKMTLFVYEYSYEGGDAAYTAFAGPYAIKAKEFTRGEATGSLWEEYKNDKELNEKLKEYLAEYDMKLVD